MSPKSLLVANRGEIAIRVMRAAAARGLRSVAVHSEDEAGALHTRKADAAIALRGEGAAAYLDIDGILAAARAADCDALHPGYGFLAESADLARRCAEAGLVFVGPSPEALELFGDKASARTLAARCGVPVVEGSSGPTSLEEARRLLSGLGPGASLMIKAISGGGGRGVRPVHSEEELEKAFERCASEAAAAFGNGDLYIERWIPNARHVEVQVAGDATGAVVHFGERECSVQRRHQKLIEIAPAPGLAPALRERLLDAAVRLSREAGYASLGTVEFLIDADAGDAFYFIEANARLQVEHTVTEEVTGVDLVALQLDLAAGRSLAELGLSQDEVPAARGHAIQLRVNTEKLRKKDGLALPASGTLTAFEPPTGPGVRTDTAGHVGYRTNPRFDSLLAKVIVHAASPRFADAVVRAERALREFRIEGVETNLGLLQALLRHPAFTESRITTRFVEENAAELVAAAGEPQPRLHLGDVEPGEPAPPASGRAGAVVDSGDPLAVLDHGKSSTSAPGAGGTASPAAAPDPSAPPGSVAIRAPLQGTVVSVAVAVGDTVSAGSPLLVLEAMKMEHVLEADRSGVVRGVTAALGETVVEGHPIVFLEEVAVEAAAGAAEEAIDPDAIRPDLAEVIERHAVGHDARRPDAVARRRKTGQRTARENVDDLCDPGSFAEYGPLVIAAQRRRRTLDDLIERTPADGLIGGIGSVNADLFGPERSRTMVLSYDYTVLAGTQGLQNHRKKDRLFELARAWRLPVVLFTEGGGGRPGDTDGSGVAGLDCLTFHQWGALSALVPLVGINSGRCFAGNAALLGCCDVVIATANSNIGMGGPAMIEGGGLGVFRPEEVGPIDVQVRNGVVDLPVEDEAEAVSVAKRYLSYFQGPQDAGDSPDPRLLRHVIPENRLRVYDVRRVIDGLVDTGSVLELRRAFGPGMVTALARIEGKPLGIIANNPTHLAGAIDSDGADKASRFMQLCDAFDLPILFLCDTPGIMVGPEVEKTALVRHAARMFVTAGSLTVPFFTIVLRKGYGLGAQAMAGGSFKAPIFTVSWPTGEFGGMGLEGAVKLGYRGELAALDDPEARRALFDEMVDRMYEIGKAVNMSSVFEIDDVIDPADSRRWILRALASVPAPEPRSGKKRPCIDPW
jgi:acetyl/propionyl-CoA carboxylase alpha subunit/acetyl-CoA carboxylase carboxyltransferase component